ncbi:MAG: CobW family GTP-binding protein [Beijerinckiaceae bacterium]
MQRLHPIPFHVLTGFLGAGKTTLLNGWLKHPALADTLVLVNEFGDIALDHVLMESAADDIVLLPSGCVCCAVRGDLVALLENILRKRDNGRIKPFTRVILETTGMADPAPVLSTILAHPYLPLRFSIAGVVTVVDAVNGADTLRRHGEAVQQIALADWLLVSKTDLAGDDALAPLEAALRALNPIAPIRPASQFAVEDLLLPAANSSAADSWRPASGLASDRVAKHSSGISHFTLIGETPVRAESFDLFLDLLRSQKGPDLLRVKGLLALSDDPSAPVVIHAVQHILHPVQRLAHWPDGDHRSRLVFIVRDIAPDFVARLWDAFNGAGTAQMA